MKSALKKVQKKKRFLSNRALYKIMDRECGKDDDDIDIDLLLFCSDILHARQIMAAESEPKKRFFKRNFKKFILIAAAISILAATLSVASADTIKFHLNHAIANYSPEKEWQLINMENLDATPDGYQLTDSYIAEQFKALGFEPITFPELFLNGGYTVENVRSLDDDRVATVSSSATMQFKKGRIFGSFFVTKLEKDVANIRSLELNSAYNADEVNVNGMDVVIFSNGIYCSVKYYDENQNINYSISMKGSYKDILELVESIK